MQTKPITKENSSITIMCKSPWRIVSVKPLRNYQINVEFNDGTKGIVDMKQLILGSNAGVFAKLIDLKIFNLVRVEYGVVVWPFEIDLAPDAMYQEIKQNGIWVLR